MECVLCIEKSMKMETLTEEAQKAEKSSEEIKRKLNAANSSLVAIMDVEAKLREDHEHLVLQEAQVRYELEQLRKQYVGIELLIWRTWQHQAIGERSGR